MFVVLVTGNSFILSTMSSKSEAHLLVYNIKEVSGEREGAGGGGGGGEGREGYRQCIASSVAGCSPCRGHQCNMLCLLLQMPQTTIDCTRQD